MTIHRVGVRSLANIVASIYVVIGVIVGVLFTLASLAVDEGGGGAAGLLFSPLAIFVLPILYGVMGYLGGLLGGWVFNMAAAGLGGLELRVELDRKLAAAGVEGGP